MEPLAPSQTAPLPPSTDRATLQSRTIRTMFASQIAGSLSMASGLAVGALVAEDLSGSETLSGLGSTFQVLGGAIIAIPVARLMAERGRRSGLQFGYALAWIGAAVVVCSTMIRSFPLMLVGMLLFGGGTAAGGQARYAAADLALPARRGRDLSLVVWATTLGSVAGPNLVGPGKVFARAVGLPDLAGSFVFSLAGFVVAFLIVNRLLRPDPLLVARSLEAAPPVPQRRGTLRRGWRAVVSHPGALLGMLVMGLGHFVMVSVMVMTPIHMKHGHAELEVIGFVISVHILGMYALSPLVGLAVDRLGPRPVAITGGAVLAGASALASLASVGWSPLLLGALFLLGVGWSCTLVAGSTMLVGALEPHDRAAGQGVSEVFMGLVGASGGALAGVIVGWLGYPRLAVGAAVVGLLVIPLVVLFRLLLPAPSANGTEA